MLRPQMRSIIPMHRLSHTARCCLLLATLSLGCSATEQIQTAPPQPATPGASGGTAALRAPLTLTLQTGATPLPEDITSLRFRVEEVWLKPAGGDWKPYPAEVNAFEIQRERVVRKTVLSTRVPPAAYDSLAILLRDVFVLFDANAGSPLTLQRDTPLKLALPLRPEVGKATAVRLTFEPGASLTKTANCRWYFLPFITKEEDE